MAEERGKEQFLKLVQIYDLGQNQHVSGEEMNVSCVISHVARRGTSESRRFVTN